MGGQYSLVFFVGCFSTHGAPPPCAQPFVKVRARVPVPMESAPLTDLCLSPEIRIAFTISTRLQ